MSRIIKEDGWGKSSHSGSNMCVEVNSDGSKIRDSKDLDQAPLDIGMSGFAALVNGLR